MRALIQLASYNPVRPVTPLERARPEVGVTPLKRGRVDAWRVAEGGGALDNTLPSAALAPNGLELGV